MKTINAIVCTDINGAVTFQGKPLFEDNSFVKTLLEFFTSETIKINFCPNSHFLFEVKYENWTHEFQTLSDALRWTKKLSSDEIWIMPENSELENLIPLCDHLVIIEFHETAVKSDRKFSFDYSKWKCTMRKECSHGKQKIGVYFFENPGQLSAA